ncbi:hypothetical protein A3D05_05295 [Candidatus Gottesmanbacteria bacterium RIFCSPHIGHO2_02_FULL_40_24]|uniref:Glycosyltransferase 2-like domain-containing protein n=1 Tax=Candidatus Gottesmanbacteria bacterium RIFCSPHIGHO2_01_FULL_40_15 TaxID=1798376 RepID=A0A1F5Z739_9BACT|nr:MAG: hypothetical protein A2777_01930 [Candidatus Gottesmanbacteria bacterium RIFCSPHIGHO2_01_FULL_40_15]OGG16446.1 MAG: hypothetical protein A3D05_05295 [Candidatus Gottesmanbacteria bacterium RIFCSPHIGHO2_02_FULL_40_24]OGG22727.1 MAG: hypothetical protein A3B48_02925 [Candidatus Gottesmanbacteria bacterium RIFCSPLOWO2_01_FULL_40_10]OGG25560.1 MAG: hypothetical protein A3E42_04445 [Candidatus Gottesmanbacteria bacterium RIFCSPHIGHO2_12_FULL_40_13]OGG32567.1 MAG: hypothetical protein A3I80_0
MGRLINRNPNFWHRLFEISFPLLTWLTVTLPLWLSPFHPAVVAYFLLTFAVYFFYKSLTVTIYSTWSYLKLRKMSHINWSKLAKTEKDFKKLYHAVIITNYKENTEKVSLTLEKLALQDFPRKRMIIILAMEKREGEEAQKRANKLLTKFKSRFLEMGVTFHPVSGNEVVGKASNSAWAAKFLSYRIRKLGIDPDFVTVTSCDADSLIPPKYFSYLSYLFLTDKDRYYHFYWAPVLLYSNFWEVPLPVRVQATISSIIRLSALAKPSSLIQISTYSLSLKMLQNIGYWDTNIIPEDWHIFLQAFFTYGDKVRTMPIYLIITRDAVNSYTFWSTMRSRYEQEKRWAWGITDIPYAIYKFFTTPHIPVLPKLFRLIYVMETHLFWPTSFFLLTLGAYALQLINPAFNRTALGHNLPKLSGLILTMTTLFLLVLIVIDAKSRPKRPASISIAKTPLLLFQWILLPLVSFLLSSLPALEAHTRLLLGKRLEYKVTEKI